MTKNHICKSKSSLRTAQIRSNHLVVHSPKSCVHRHSNTSCRPGTGGRVGGRGATSGERRPNTNTKAKRSSCFGQISPIAKTPRNLSLATLATPLTAAKRIDVCPRAHPATPAAERIATLTLVTSTNTPPEAVPPRRGRQIANEVEATDGSNSTCYYMYPTRLSCNPSSRVRGLDPQPDIAPPLFVRGRSTGSPGSLSSVIPLAQIGRGDPTREPIHGWYTSG